MSTEKLGYDAIEKLQAEFAKKATTNAGRWRVAGVMFHFDGYAEPSYTDPPSGVIVLGNWNKVYAGRDDPEDTTPKAFGDALAALGVELEWSDEWSACDVCQKLVRTEADSYHWRRAYTDDNDGNYVVCLNCVDPGDHLKSLEGKDRKCNTIAAIDPADHGYRLVEDKFESGWHHGQDARPELIGKALRAAGVSRYVFNLDGVGQFDAEFSVYVHETEYDRLDRDAYAAAPKDGPSNAEALSRALREVPLSPAPGHVSVTHIKTADQADK